MTFLPAPQCLPATRWQARERAHTARVEALTAGHRDRAARRQPHPVEDFLFTYYSHRPSQLRRWHPGVGAALGGPEADERLGRRWYARVEATDQRGRPVTAVGLDVGALLTERRDSVTFVRDLLAATAGRPAQLGCFGLHEWAMVYRSGPDAVRHQGWPLRLGADGTDAVVERHRIRCTHFDAFRFFTGPARPRNTLQPDRASQLRLEQPGCLHATMDLYKWAYKLSPAVPGELLVDCFELAREVRELDMRASPYDLRDLGLEPVAIETPEGKAAYARAQRGFAQRGAALRGRLLEVCEALLTAAGESGPRGWTGSAVDARPQEAHTGW